MSCDHLLVQFRKCAARHCFSFLHPQQPVEILGDVFAAEVSSLSVRHQHPTALHHLHKAKQGVSTLTSEVLSFSVWLCQ